MTTVLSRLALAAGLLALQPLAARAGIEPGYVPDGTPAPTTWYRWADPAAIAADRAYVAGMRQHHAGALTMSEAYLADPAAGSPALRALAAGIIRNQRFEIAVLDEVARNLDLPPLRLGVLALQPVATEGLAQRAQFQRSPLPAPVDGPVTERDVGFAKAMILHHEAALRMVRDYRAAPAAANGFLGLLNVDIVTDQASEITLMRRVIAAWPGDAAAVPVPPDMVHGMPGMDHGAASHGMAPMVTAPAAAPVAPHAHRMVH